VHHVRETRTIFRKKALRVACRMWILPDGITRTTFGREYHRSCSSQREGGKVISRCTPGSRDLGGPEWVGFWVGDACTRPGPDGTGDWEVRRETAADAPVFLLKSFRFRVREVLEVSLAIVSLPADALPRAIDTPAAGSLYCGSGKAAVESMA